MNEHLIGNISARPTGTALARFGVSHGYRFDGDTAHLNAMFTILNPDAHQRSWALQLWACPEAPSGGNAPTGHLVAQAALPPIGEIADEQENFSVNAFASKPAGQTGHVMVLVLASGARGQFDEVHDLAVYPRREQFLQPRLAGNASFRVEGQRVTIEVGRIENPRAMENVSGTLSLELWALKDRFTGGAFHGEPLAGVTFGPLSGQHESTLKSFDLPFTAPSAGTWHYVLMLREWTPAGFVTRDFVNFATPVTVAAPSVEAKPVEPKAKKSNPAPAARKITLNTATVQEIRALTGVPEKVAKGIVASRPFKSLNEVQKVKGVGAKLLAKIRSKLKL